jgi:TRAP-type C4-dicarboxylate transport system permease small subunit
MTTGAEMAFLRRLTEFLNRFLTRIAGGVMAVMILLTCANIVMRLVWVPIQGTFELMGYFGAIITAFALGYTQIHRGHISVDILVLGFSAKTRRVLNSINAFVCMIFFVIAAWQIAKYATTLMRSGEVTETLRIIYYPFPYAVSLGCLSLALVFFTDLLNTMFSPVEDET